jgi:cobalamin biosynthesis protein CobT
MRKPVSDANPVSAELGEATAKALKEGSSVKGGYRALTTEEDLVIDARTGVYGEVLRSSTSGDRRYHDIAMGMRGEVSVMQRKIERAMMDFRRRDMVGGFEAGKLDPKTFASVVSRGNPKAFKQREVSRAVNTAVTLLIDFSGSMSGEKSDLATQATIALAETLDRIGVAIEVLGFNASLYYAYSGEPRRLAAREWRNGGMKTNVRTEPLSLWVLKDFEAPLRTAKSAIAAIPALCTGNNCDGESVEWAYGRLRVRSEPKKILMVLSDGLPAVGMGDAGGIAGTGKWALREHLKEVVRRIDREIPVVGIGILHDAVSLYYPKHVVVNHISDLPKTVIDQIAKLLLGKRFDATNHVEAA